MWQRKRLKRKSRTKQISREEGKQVFVLTHLTVVQHDSLKYACTFKSSIFDFDKFKISIILFDGACTIKRDDRVDF